LGGGDTLAVLGGPPPIVALAIRPAGIAKPYEYGLDTSMDVTVSAGELLESVDPAGSAGVPEAVTGPPWAGVLPPRGGWRSEAGLPGMGELRGLVAAAVAEFKARVEELPAERRVRAELDQVGREIWSRSIGDTGLPVRAAHAAQALGFLRGESLDLLSSGAWLRLRTSYGSVAVRRAGVGGLSVSPA
ncbi:hypothetical protein ACFWY6_43540, partial [Streptomyces sp. NPDC059037]|uniref:hypothetical protein n=1 Tax=Streptomyces sp. NPDC059037 TaxID=3346710 RepID=UPI003679C164